MKARMRGTLALVALLAGGSMVAEAQDTCATARMFHAELHESRSHGTHPRHWLVRNAIRIPYPRDSNPRPHAPKHPPPRHFHPAARHHLRKRR